jgi:hypothetical protein
MNYLVAIGAQGSSVVLDLRIRQNVLPFWIAFVVVSPGKGANEFEKMTPGWARILPARAETI